MIKEEEREVWNRDVGWGREGQRQKEGKIGWERRGKTEFEIQIDK